MRFTLNSSGFSLIELLIALAITLGLSTVIFQLFRQNERIFRDQFLIMEMQQSARLAATQISDDLRMAGQGVPDYNALQDTLPAEASAVIMAGSDSTRLNLRLGFSNVESSVVFPAPLELQPSSAVTCIVENAVQFSNVIGASPIGRYVYLWGQSPDSTWAWSRASVISIATATNSIRIVVEQTEDSTAAIRWSGSPRISLEEAVTLYRDPASRSIRRATATNLTNPANPVWASANELATNVNSLLFTYYDKSGNPVSPTTTAIRHSVKRIEVQMELQTSSALSNGSKPRVALHLRSTPRNLNLPGNDPS